MRAIWSLSMACHSQLESQMRLNCLGNRLMCRTAEAVQLAPWSSELELGIMSERRLITFVDLARSWALWQGKRGRAAQRVVEGGCRRDEKKSFQSAASNSRALIVRGMAWMVQLKISKVGPMSSASGGRLYSDLPSVWHTLCGACMDE